MQTIGLPRHVTRGAALAARPCAKEHGDAAHRRDILKRWHRARDNGLSAAAAADAVGVSRATLYRWRKLRDRGRLAPQSRRPHRLRRPAWAPALVKAVREAAPPPHDPARQGKFASTATMGSRPEWITSDHRPPRRRPPRRMT